MAKISKTFRLSEMTAKRLEHLAKLHGISQADVISVMVYCFTAGLPIDEWDQVFESAKMING